jgi:predicted GIY-YIG superfamily endonuclease
MLRSSDGGPIQMYEDPYDPIISYSSPMAGWLYARDAEIPNYWIAVSEEPVQDQQSEEAATARKQRTPKKSKGGDDSIRTALYRLRNASGELLYVGISAKPPQRWGQHAAEKEWWPEVAGLSLEWFDSRAEALAMEAHAIRTERPIHNVQHNSSAA